MIILINFVFSIDLIKIPYFTDQINHSVYYLNPIGLSVQSDIIYKAVMIDGTIKKPLGSYSFDRFYIPDSLNSSNYFSWKQGDYLLRDLTLFSRYILYDSSKVIFQANGRSFAGKNALQGPSILDYNNNSLQNYYIDYIKKYERSDINFGIFYHLEDVGLPIASNEFNNRESESIHLGIDYQYFSNNLNFSSQYYLESGLINYSNNIEYFSEIFLINTSYNYKSIKLSSKIYRKLFSTSIDDSFFIDKSIELFNFDVGPEFESSFFKLGFDLYQKKVYLNLNALYSFYNCKVYLTRKNRFYNYMNRDYENIFLKENYDKVQSLMFEYSNPNINVSTALKNSIINSEFNNSIQLYSKAIYEKNYIDLKYIYNDSNIAFINQYANLEMFLSPDLFWTDRYRFFINLNLFYYKTFNNNSYDPNELYYFTKSNNVYKDYFINNGFGLIVDNFKITYCINFISINDFYVSNTYLPIKPISFFKIDWIFQD